MEHLIHNSYVIKNYADGLSKEEFLGSAWKKVRDAKCDSKNEITFQMLSIKT